MRMKKLFYMREDLKNNYSKLKIYKSIFTFSLMAGLILMVVSIVPPVIPFGIFAGASCATASGYFLLSIHIHSGR